MIDERTIFLVLFLTFIYAVYVRDIILLILIGVCLLILYTKGKNEIPNFEGYKGDVLAEKVKIPEEEDYSDLKDFDSFDLLLQDGDNDANEQINKANMVRNARVKRTIDNNIITGPDTFEHIFEPELTYNETRPWWGEGSSRAEFEAYPHH